MSARFVPSTFDVDAQTRSNRAMSAARPAFILALAALALASAACEPAAPAPENGSVPAPVAADASAAPSVATTIDPAGTSAPTIISVTAELNGPVFVDGVRAALATPLEAHRVVTGRHEVQVVGPGAVWLSQPTLMLAREGVHSRIHLRNQAQRTSLNIQEIVWDGSGELGPMNTMAGVPQFPPGVDWTTGMPNAMLPTPVEGSAPPAIAAVNLPGDPASFLQNWQPTALQGGGTLEGSANSPTEASADNSLPNNAAEASGNAAPMQAAPGEASTAAPDVEGSVAPTAEASAAAPVSEGSTATATDGSALTVAEASAATPEPPTAALPADLPVLNVWLVDPRQPANAERTRIYVTSRPAGVVYINNVSTGRLTPVLIDVEPGEISLQVLYENGDLSKSLPVNSNAGQGRAVYFIGPLDFALR
jgi:hypothetical protein